jgi:hypothetical protein
MGKATGFLEYGQKHVPYRDALERIDDFKEIYTHAADEHLKIQGAQSYS